LKLFTIGHTKKNLQTFVRLLREAGVDAVIDIRLNNTSQLAGYAKKDDLSFLLETYLNIRYRHVPELAPTKELLAQYRVDKDWEAYESGFAQIMRERDGGCVAVDALSGFERPCLLCSEHDPDKCHRRLVAELVVNLTAGVEVVHLK